MRHENSLFHALSKQIPWSEFDRLVDEHRADRGVRRLDTKSQLLAMLFAQLAGASSLREIEAGLASHSARLYHLGMKAPARSTLADANARRPWQVFAGLFEHMVGQANRGTRRRMREVTRILDATRIPLSRQSADWVKPVNNHYAAKMHTIYDPDQAMPLGIRVTPERISDLTAARQIKFEPGATYVFDMGYYEYDLWARMHALGCRIVTRFKPTTRLCDAVDCSVPQEADAVLSDRIGHLPKRLARSRRNPMSAPVRELVVRISTGRTIRVLTNDLSAPAQEVADLYKQRWQIELFFKWIKQNLRIKRFLGTSHNAVCIQIFTALITFLLLKAAHQTQSGVASIKRFTHLVTLNLMHRRSIANLHAPPQPPPLDPNQTTLEFVLQ